MPFYSSLSSRWQVAAIRCALVEMLDRYGIRDHPLSLRLHAYNTTFRLQLLTGDVAVRVNMGSKRTIEQVRGEVAWTEALRQEGRVSAPAPVALFDGSAVSLMRVEGIDRDLPVVAYGWLPGRHIRRTRPLWAARKLGGVMADLHAMTRTWHLPEGTSRPVLTTVLHEFAWKLPETGPYREVYERADAVLKGQPESARQLVHFDLHFNNVKMWRGRMSVFDFDDSVISTAAIDAAQAIHALRRELGDPLEEAFWVGAGTSPEGLGVTPGEFEFLLGGRALLLATAFLDSDSARLAEMAPRFLKMTERRLEHLLKAGQFDPAVAKMSDFA
jgi:Ser/Thr protein kinase RdoA (MazF antagonist)